MLVDREKPLNIFKLPSGDEVIGRVDSSTPMEYWVTNPLVLIPTQKGVQFAPFMMMINPEKPVRIPSQVITGTPSDGISSAYESATTGIALPPKQSIITG